MNRKFYCLFIVLMFILFGCSKDQSFDSFFQSKMNEMEGKGKYSLIQKMENENNALAVFTTEDNKKIYIAYMEKIDRKWEWRKTRGTEWDTPQKWSVMDTAPYIYSGAISDPSISKVLVGNDEAEIIEVKGNNRFWYFTGKTMDEKVTTIKVDGSEEILNEFEFS
ncbi:hypothetical protein [Peribacillus sp. FSL E2-0159]|uniref:hypothetical protein n=1 Tax=Peribacillus sp. FSL E2-0159 TaxID=2975289 RepID=UPI00315A2F55